MFIACTFGVVAQMSGTDSDKPVRQGTIQRRVLIFDFENQTGKIEFDYLSGSISDALVEAVKKTGKFRLMLREEARMNTYTDAAGAATNEPKPGASSDKPAATMSVAVNRNDAIKRGREAGADVVVLGKFSELNGVLLLSAQAYESDTRLLKVSEEVLTKSDSDMFNGINILAAKIAEAMARELPMFDATEAERRKNEASSKTAEARDWEIQLFAGIPLLHPLYSSDGTITYSKGVPVQKTDRLFSGRGTLGKRLHPQDRVHAQRRAVWFAK